MRLPADPPPSLGSLEAKIDDLQHQSATILFLGAINLIMNVLTIAIGFLMTV
jgi:hypothetical protein